MVQALSRFCVIVALALSSSSLPAGAQADTPTGQVPQIAFEKYVLENGLEVILTRYHRLPLTAVNLWYHVGPATAVPGRTGFAHLFEHRMFQGSKHVAKEKLFKVLRAAG